MPDDVKPIANRPEPDEALESAQRTLMTVARERYQRAVDYDLDNRDEALEDLEFLSGDQWPEEIRNERIEDGRPILTINRIKQYSQQVIGDIRQNASAIKVRPAGGGASKEISDVFSGLIRGIEAASSAKTAYTTAAEGQVQCGIGHFRIVTEYADDDVFEQNIRIRPIRDHFGVAWDPQSTMLTREDARYCFVEENLDIETFRVRYPNADLTGFDFQDQSTYSYLGDWFTHQTVRIAEYWTKEMVERTLAELVDGKVVDITEADRDENGIVLGEDGRPLPFVRTRNVMRPQIEMRLINGVEVLKGPFKWAGRYIPIIPVIGEEIHIGRKTMRFGVIRHAKDPQRMYNYLRSAQTEFMALQPKAPFTVTADNISGYEDVWKQANTRNLPYLPYKPDKLNNGQPPQRTIPPLRSEGLMGEIGIAADDMKATTGIYDAGVGAQGNETSGKAILARQRESDVSTFTYPDNHAKAIEHAGRILVDLIPKIYDTERVVRVLNEDETSEDVSINETVIGDDGEEHKVNDLTVGKYDVTVATGPSYSTKRAEAADGMFQLVQSVPDIGKVIMDLLIKNLDWPGADEIAERLRKMLPPGLEEPREGEEEGVERQPTPEEIQANAQMQADEREQARKDAETAAKVEASRAETEGQHLENLETQLRLAAEAGTLEQFIEEQVVQALASLAANASQQPVQTL